MALRIRDQFLLGSLLSLLGQAPVLAAGIEVPFISISGLGSANASAAEGNDASVQYFNPAGMARLKGGSRVSQPFGLIFGGGKVTNDTSNQGGTQAVQSYGSADSVEDGRPVDGRQSSEFLPAVLPLGSLFVSHPIDDTLTFGLGVFSPGGGNINYKGDYFGRFQLKSAALEMISINPSLAIRLDDKHSIGFGASVIGAHSLIKKVSDPEGASPYFAQNMLSNANATQLAGLGAVLSSVSPELKSLLQSIQVGIAYDALPDNIRGPINTAAAQLLLDPSSTVKTMTTLWGYGLGYNLGYMYQISDQQRIGLSYRSESIVHMRGDLEWDLSKLSSTTSQLDALLFDGKSMADYVSQYVFPDTTAKLDLIIPAKFDLAYFYSITPRIDLMANWQFNRSSAVQSACITYTDQPGGADGSVHLGEACLDLKSRDTSTVSLGMNYHVDDKLSLRTGIQYDQTPVPSATYRGAGSPDSNRRMLALGTNYKIDANTNLDFAYAYMMAEDSKADYHQRCRISYYEGTPSNSNNCLGDGGNFRATYSGVHAHIIGLQLNKQF